MGTNFYFRDEDRTHIGKRSAAGQYCWDCRQTLCKAGEARIHFTRTGNGDTEWHQACPKCGKGPRDEKLTESAAGIELGFAKPAATKPKGVTSICSWTWACKPELLRAPPSVAETCGHCRQGLPDPDKPIEDEYGTLYTMEQFEAMLEANCPVRYYDSIGTEFC